MPTKPEPPTTDACDSDLLRRFSAQRDEEVFRLLVERHGPLVLGVCRRNTFANEDAEDAFQATFLVLSQSAGSIRRGSSLSAWLYGVALRVSARVRRGRPADRPQSLEEDVPETRDPLDELLARHDGMIADEELSALPENLRQPLVLRYLAGKSNQQTAAELGITVAALEGRLKRGKSRLRARLLRRGVTLAAVVATLKSTQVHAGALPAPLVEATAALGCQGAAGPLATSSPLSNPTITNIALEELKIMHALALPKLLLPFGAAGVALLAMGVHLAYSQGAGADTGTSPLQLQSEAADAPGDSEALFAAGAIATAPAAEDNPFGAIAATAADANPFNASPRDAFVASPPQTPAAANSFVAAVPPGVARIENSLASQLTTTGLDFVDAPLEEVIDFLRTEYDIEIQLDERSLDDIAIGRDEPITCNLRRVSLDAALNLILDKLELTHVVANEVLLITTQEHAHTLLDTKLYHTRGLGIDAESLRETILKTVAPETWSDGNGGEAEFEPLPSGDVLVRQTYAGHKELSQVLKQLAASQAGSPASGDRQADAAPRAGVQVERISTAESGPVLTLRGAKDEVERVAEVINTTVGPDAPTSAAAPAAAVQTLRALKSRYSDLLEQIQRKQEAYNALAKDSGSILDARNAAENQLDIELLTRLRGELLEMRRKDATTQHGAPIGEYMDELRTEIAELTERVLTRAEENPDLQRRGEEIEQLKQIAAGLQERIEELETERAIGEESPATTAGGGLR
ncbi:sigma-70 family RNA polymerase sigma factor [Posidoniimonas corsicana]|nr:sigma-70 family RNA polymerase sigma factor [Posidoniimonas corsicana]